MINKISLRKKALYGENFPNQELIEFLIKKDSVPTKLDIEWKQPQVNQFVVNILLHIYYNMLQNNFFVKYMVKYI